VRILMFFPSLGRGGTEEHALVVTEAGARAGHEMVTCFPWTAGTESVLADARAAGHATVRWPLGTVVDGRGQYGSVAQQEAAMLGVLESVRPDAVLMMLPWPDTSIGALGACATVGVPTVPVFCLVRDVITISPEDQRRAAAARARNQRWVAVSEENARILRRLFAIPEQEELPVVYNGVDLPEPWRDPAESAVAEVRSALRRSLGIPAEARVAMTVGRLSRPKGHRDILAAAARLTGPAADTHFVWVGEGDDRAALRTAAAELGLGDRVHLLGYRRDVAALLHAADLFVFPTHGEGCSRALIEAMAVGLPVVASDASSNPELVTHGRHGLLYPVRDAVRLAKRLQTALDDPAGMRQMAAAARKRARRELTAGAMCDGTYRVLDEVMGKPRIGGPA